MKAPILAAIAVGLVLLGILFISVDWEARALRGRLDKLISLVEKDGPEGAISSAAKASQVPGFFIESPTIRMTDTARRIRDKSELKGAVLALRTQAMEVDVDLSRYQLIFSEDRLSADMTFRAKVTILGDSGFEGGSDDVQMEWIKEEDQTWRIASIEMRSER